MRPLALSPWHLKNRIDSHLAGGCQFTSFDYPDGALRKYKVRQFEGRLASGQPCFGLGVATDERSASIKAFFEYLERKAFYEKGIALGFETTNGFAIHKFRFLAKQAAISELVERDAFLVHWYSRTPYSPVPSHLTSFLKPQIIHLRQLGFETVLVKTELGFADTYVTFLINRKSAGFAIGTSSGKSVSQDLEKSFIEACTNLFLIAEDESAARSRISRYGIHTLQDHRSFWLHLQTFPSWIIDKRRMPVRKLENLRSKIEVVSVDSTEYQTVAARSDGFVNLSQGPASPKELMKVRRRVQALLGSDLDVSQTLIHPIP